jgi:hypothetical protein
VAGFLAVITAIAVTMASGGIAFAAAAPTGINYKDQTVFDADKGDEVTIAFDNADIRDILSIFANKLDINMIYLGSGFSTSFSISGVSATRAFEIFMKSTGASGPALSYVREDDLVIVGPVGALRDNFSEMMVFTSFELEYITAQELTGYLSTLGINVNSLILDESTNRLFVQGFPYEISKVNEVINMLDREEYFPEGSTQEINIIPYRLKYISAGTLKGVMGTLGVQADTIIMNANPETLWVSAGTSEHDSIKKIIAKLDTVENISDNEFGVYRLKYIDIDLVNNAMSELGLWTTAEGESGKVTVIPNTVLSKDPYAILVNFKFVDKEMVDFLIAELDTPSNRPEDPAFFIYTFKNLTAGLALDRIGSFGPEKTYESEEVTFKEFSFPGLGRQIMVLCTKSEESAVRNFLGEIDKLGEPIKAVVDRATGSMQARLDLIKRIPLISYFSGVPEENMYVSDDISKSGSPSYVMWVEDTPENIDKVRAAIGNIDTGN